MSDSKSPVKTTLRSIELLDLIKSEDGATASELAERTDLARSTVHNHLRCLIKAGYIIKEENTYHVGLQMYILGEYARTRKPGYLLAKRYTEELAMRTGLEVDFNVEEYGQLINVYGANGHTNDPDIELGSHFHLHNTAVGKAILAEYSDERVDGILDEYGLPATTDHTITDRSALRKEIKLTAERGYAINDQELFSGYKSLGKVVLQPDGKILGGIAVGGPVYAIGETFDQSVVSAVSETVSSLQAEIVDEMFK